MLLIPLFALSVGQTGAVDATPKPTPSVAFVENKGQWSDEALYRLSQPGLDYWVANDGLVFDYNTTQDGLRSGHVVRMRFEGAAPYAKGVGGTQMDGVENYYRNGNAAIGAKRFENVRVENLAKGISAKYYLDAGSPRYDLEVAPGADPNGIAIRYEGVGSLRTDGQTVTFGTKFGNVQVRNLFAYQTIAGKIVPVEAAFQKLDGNRIGFRVGNYNPQYKLTIDPQVVVRGSYIGGSSTDYALDLDSYELSDPSGAESRALVVAGASASTDFPITAGSYSGTIQSSSDAFVTVFDTRPMTSSQVYPTYRLRYSTFVSAPGNQINGIGTDPVALTSGFNIRMRQGGSVMVGMTAGDANYPVNGSAGVITTATPIQGQRKGNTDAWVALLDANGGAIYSATYFGGGADDVLRDVDSTGSGLVLAGVTNSGQTGGNPFPIVGSNADNTRGGANDGFVSIINAKCTSIVMSTYLGGSSGDSVRTIRRASNGSILVAGTTTSPTGFPGISNSSIDNLYGGRSDGFVSVVAEDGKVNYSTYFGADDNTNPSTDPNELINDIRESNGDIYIGGRIAGTNYQRTLGNFTFFNSASYDKTLGGAVDGFVARLNGSLTRLVAFTFVGGSDNFDSVEAITNYGTQGRVAVTGYTGSTDLGVTADALTPGTGRDAFVYRLNNGLSTLIHGTRFGGNGDDYAFGITETNVLNNLAIAGITGSSNLPFPSANAFDSTNTLGETSGFVSEFGYYDDVQRIVITRNPVAFGQSTFVAMFFNIPVQNVGGQLAHVSTSDPSVLLSVNGVNPDSITVPQGAEKAALKLIPQAGLIAPTNVTVTVTSGGATRTAVVTVNP